MCYPPKSLMRKKGMSVTAARTFRRGADRLTWAPDTLLEELLLLPQDRDGRHEAPAEIGATRFVPGNPITSSAH